MHNEAVRIEHIIRELNGGYRGTYCGIADADFIQNHLSIALALFYGIMFDRSDDINKKCLISELFEESQFIIRDSNMYNIDLTIFEYHQFKHYTKPTDIYDFINKVIDNMLKIIWSEGYQCII